MDELKRVMLVEDSPDIQSIAKLVLESVGKFEVCICSDAREMLDRVSEFEPQLILMDMMMPGMDGATALQELRSRQNASSIPVIFMTAKIQVSEIEFYRKLGALDVIGKPFDPMTLSKSVLDIWEARPRK